MNRVYFRLVVILWAAMSLSCGSSSPFQRGKIVKEQDGQVMDAAQSNLDQASFNKVILPILNSHCNACHTNPAPTYSKAIALVVYGHPEQSKLYQKMTGLGGHYKVFDENSVEAVSVKNWINGGKI
jgi:hypothetical protein